MIELNKLPAWIVNADKDLMKFRQQIAPQPTPEPPTPKPEQPKIIEEVKSIKPVKKKVDKYNQDSDEEQDYKPKKKKSVKKKKKYESEEEEAENALYRRRFSCLSRRFLCEHDCCAI